MGSCSCTVFRNLCCCTRCFRCKNFCLLPAVFRSRSFDYVVLNRQKPYKTSFVGGQVFRTSVCCKICKNFCLLPAVFRSRSFEHVVFAYVVFAQAKTLQDEFCRWASFLPTAFFCAVTTVKCFVIANHQSVLSVSHCLFLQKTVAFCL